jgi:hypothetical protein
MKRIILNSNISKSYKVNHRMYFLNKLITVFLSVVLCYDIGDKTGPSIKRITSIPLSLDVVFEQVSRLFEVVLYCLDQFLPQYSVELVDLLSVWLGLNVPVVIFACPKNHIIYRHP